MSADSKIVLPFTCLSDTCSFSCDTRVEILKHAAFHRAVLTLDDRDGLKAHIPWYYREESYTGVKPQEVKAPAQDVDSDDNLSELEEVNDAESEEKKQLLRGVRVLNRLAANMIGIMSDSMGMVHITPLNNYVQNDLTQAMFNSMRTVAGDRKKVTDAWPKIRVFNLQKTVGEFPDEKVRECQICTDKTFYGLVCKEQVHEICKTCIEKAIEDGRKNPRATSTHMVCPFDNQLIKLE